MSFHVKLALISSKVEKTRGEPISLGFGHMRPAEGIPFMAFAQVSWERRKFGETMRRDRW